MVKINRKKNAEVKRIIMRDGFQYFTTE